jgi:alpha-tubulin suppressor-like RCC1 family protein
MALKSNGTVVAWGYKEYGQSDIPIEITNALAIAAGASHNLVLKADGTVVGWGQSEWRAGVVPDNLRDIVAIAAGFNTSLALIRDGTVVGWGFNRSGGATGRPSADKYPWTESGVVKIESVALKNVAAISAGKEYGLALKRDGTVASWGNVPPHDAMSNVTAIAAGENYFLILKRDNSSTKH